MKSFYFLFIAVGFAALSLGRSFAVEISDRPPGRTAPRNQAKDADNHSTDPVQKSQPRAGREQADGNRSDHKPDERPVFGNGTKATEKRYPVRKPPLPLPGKEEHSGGKQTGNAQATTTSGNAAVPFHQSALDATAKAAKPGPTIDKMEDHRDLPVERLSGLTLAPPSQAVPRRGSGPAIIGGAAASSTRNTAIISGTMMKHKP